MGAKASRDKLSKEDLDFLVTNTHYTEDTISDWYKGFMVDCPGGKLSPASFMKIYSQCFPAGNAKEFCEHVFRTFDSDKNGFVDFKEFLLAIDVTSSGTPEEKLNWAFSMYDVDGNGGIDLVEMTNLVKSIYQVMGPNKGKERMESAEERARTIFKKMDRDGDGEVTREEFVQTCLIDKGLIELLTPQTAECHVQ